MDLELMQVQPLYPHHLSRGLFGIMLVISLALHVIFSIMLLSPHSTSFTGPAVTYLELKDFSVRERATALDQHQAKSEETVAKVPDESPAALPTTTTASAILQQDVKDLVTTSRSKPEKLHERSFGLGLTSGYFSSLAKGETLRNDIKDYYFSMLREINEKWWLANEGDGDRARGAIVEIVIARNGMIVNKTLVRSSGSPAFDRKIFTTLEKANPLPPLPNDYQMNYFSAPIRFVAPMGLFAS